MPRQVTVLSSNGWPSALLESGRSVQITAVEDCWCIDDEWWRDRVQRRYFQVATASGSRRTLYHDVIADRWYEQRY